MFIDIILLGIQHIVIEVVWEETTLLRSSRLH